MNFKGLFIAGLLLLCMQTFAQKQGKARGRKGEQVKATGKNSSQKMDWELKEDNTILGEPTDRSITASILAPKGSSVWIEYGKSGKNFNQKSASATASGDAPVEIVLNHLDPGSNYAYRIVRQLPGNETIQFSQPSWFSTQKKKEQSFSFGVQGDSHPERLGKMFHPDLYRQTLDSVSFYKPDFYFMMGDDFNIDRLLASNTATRENVEKAYLTQRYFLGNPGKNPPLFLVNGNHEQAARYLLDGTENNAAVQAGNARKKFFPLPAPGKFYSGDEEKVEHVGLLKDYYAFEWGNALFVVIDPYWHSEVVVDNQPVPTPDQRKKDPWGITLGAEQYQWFKKTLESSKAKFKFVFSHHVSGTGRGGVERAGLFEWGGQSQNGAWMFEKYRPGWDLPIHQLMVKNKVTIFFQGHDHLYARQELDGVIYQSVPNPADDTHTAFNKEAYKSGTILPNSGFLHVTVKPKEVIVDYIRSYFHSEEGLSKEITESVSYIQRN